MPIRCPKGQLKLTAGSPVLLAVIDNYYKVAGTYGDGECHCFELDATGRLTYRGENACTFLFVGTSDVLADKTCTIHYGLYLNGEVISGEETPATFEHANSYKNISINRIVTLNPNDYVEVHAKSDTTNTTITPSTLALTFWGENA